MSDSIETKGKTVDLAVSEALLQLGLRRDEVDIKVLEEPRAGLMGFLGARQAKVLVSKRRPTRGGRSGGRDRQRDDDHRAHDLTADGSSGRGRGRGGRTGQSSQGNQGRSDGRGGRSEGRAEPRGENRGEARGGRTDGRPERNDRGGRGRRDETPRDTTRDQTPRPPAAGDERAAAPGQGEAQGEALRSRRRRGGRGRGGRGRTDQGGPREDQLKSSGAEAFDAPNERVEAGEIADRPARGERGGRDQRGGRGGRDQRGGRSDRGERVERPVRERDGNRETRFDAPEGGVRGDEQPRDNLLPREEAMPRERAREERSRRDLHVTPAPAVVEPNLDETEAAVEIVAPEMTESPAAVPVAPRVKPRAWGGLGARRERAPQTQPLVRVHEPSPASVGAVYKPSRKAAARAAARLPEANPSPIGEVAAPQAGPSGNVGYGTASGNSGGGYSRRGGSDVTIAVGIAATDYAKPRAPVDEAGQPALLTELTTGMLARAGFPCECDTIPGEYHAVKVSADEDSAGMLIGRGGSTAESIEHLVERMASNAAGDRVRMNLDINEYRIGREEALREHTAEAVAEVRSSGEPYHMEPMDARERRVVHMATEALADITTYTVIGSGGKHVVIAMNDGSQTKDSGGPEGSED